jgi:hypothetical protein
MSSTCEIDTLLRLARANNPDGSRGLAQRGAVSVVWDRPDQVYEVGTDAQLHARGRRAQVLPTLLSLLTAHDCKTSDDCAADEVCTHHG